MCAINFGNFIVNICSFDSISFVVRHFPISLKVHFIFALPSEFFMIKQKWLCRNEGYLNDAFLQAHTKLRHFYDPNRDWIKSLIGLRFFNGTCCIHLQVLLDEILIVLSLLVCGVVRAFWFCWKFSAIVAGKISENNTLQPTYFWTSFKISRVDVPDKLSNWYVQGFQLYKVQNTEKEELVLATCKKESYGSNCGSKNQWATV